MRSVFNLPIALFLSLLASGCANIKSQRVNEGAAGYDGLIYHLPLKDIRLSVTVADDSQGSGATKIYTPNVEAGEAYPDMSSSFLMTISRSEFGSNSLEISVSTSGLLSVSKSTSTSAVDDIAKSIASSMASRRLDLFFNLGRIVASPDQSCPVSGVYSRLVTFDELKKSDQNLCGFDFHVTSNASRLPSPTINDVAPLPNGGVAGNAMALGRVYSGIYYRQAIPVHIEATQASLRQLVRGFIVFIPDENAVYKLPVPRNFFANNSTNITLSDGMPTGYNPQKNSEVLGLFKIPADVIGAYFEAFGKLFTAFGDAKKSEAAASANVAYLQLQESKTQLCLKAIAANDADGIKASCPTSAE
ncbi:hypothetical protein ISP17_03470 [Dyella ginsengisoli]|uniref:Lipoprotein n=1 Tax=Dyella ginsengisoli TaxID=363848 RepID=A0ABW8JRD3_9GAMM